MIPPEKVQNYSPIKMLIPSLQRHLNVGAQIDLPRFSKMDPDFWNVISLREPSRPKPDFSKFASSHTTICYDVMGREGKTWRKASWFTLPPSAI